MSKSLISDPNHLTLKRKKIITELPNGKNLPKEMQNFIGNKPLVKVADDETHDQILEVFKVIDDKTGPMFDDREFELYYIPAFSENILIYDSDLNEIWITKDTNINELNPNFYA